MIKVISGRFCLFPGGNFEGSILQEKPFDKRDLSFLDADRVVLTASNLLAGRKNGGFFSRSNGSDLGG